ncbi:DnaJ domain-containing protein [Salinibacterium sp. G-O1]|uniref:J domain-containing protein n=1 Tax=Salinibacterium sp. G-O1 TaxID=3046208 RepID=UPI0024BAC8BA|nr:DnaJ domain-containing protein [Salinibacterium sp. G-O1]MDJ0335062.1 DnaJ domain-containing protein [Salinibacterium sp. G-O1]
MPESPLSASPYEVLGVAASASDDELRRAFRKALRETHPDTGGDPGRFNAVQEAWDYVGTAQKRAAYDSGRGIHSRTHETFTTQAARPRQDTRPKARSHGHPGGWRREKFLGQLREWVGRGVEITDPYDPALVRSAPREIRRTLADALAEESTARTLSTLGIGFTVWHDVSTGEPESKIDHVVLGPTGLFAMLSEDFGGPVRIRRGELIGDVIAGERPMHELAVRAKVLSRQLRVRFTGLVIVLPDDALAESVTQLGSVRGAATLAVTQTSLAMLLRQGIPGSAPIGGNELFDVRTRVADGVRFV